MFGNLTSYGNRKVDAVHWTDKNGNQWVQAVTAEAAIKYGTKPFKPYWVLSGGLVCVPRN